MKVVHVNSNDVGGAAQASKNLHYALLRMGIHSTFLSKYYHSTQLKNHYAYLKHKSVHHYMDYLLENYLLRGLFPPNDGYSQDTVLFTSPHSLFRPEVADIIQAADIVHLHWTSHFLDYQNFFNYINKPVVWSLHDMNAFTGGCHYAHQCSGFITGCTTCPQIGSTNQPQAAETYFIIKKQSIENFKKLLIAAPSRWMLNQSAKSLIFKNLAHFYLPNVYDPNVFKIGDPVYCKNKWNIPSHKINLLFVVHSFKIQSKGFGLLKLAIKLLPQDNFHCTLVGKDLDDIFLNDITYTKVNYVQKQVEMAELYNAAEILMHPSICDNAPNTIAESLLCGTPVIAFNVGGVPEMIEDGMDGFLTYRQSAQDFADAILKFVQQRTKFNRETISTRATLKFNDTENLKPYLKLYSEMMDETAH